MEPEELRVGDRERDEAIGWLREHLSTGRLDPAEFDDRMSRALQARTRRELEGLFFDLPDPKPSANGSQPYSAPSPYDAPSPYGPPSYGQPSYGEPTYGAPEEYPGAPYSPAPYDPTYQPNPYAPVPAHQGLGGEPQYRNPPTPWYAQWWLLLAAFGFSAITGARLGFLVPLIAIWIWVIYPQIAKSRQVPVMPPRQLSYPEQEQILLELRSGRKIAAVKRYRELTGADLRTAKEHVEAMARQIGY